MKKIKVLNEEDYILWNFILKTPVESIDIIYHYTTIIDLINDRFTLSKNSEKFISLLELPIEWQNKYLEYLNS